MFVSSPKQCDHIYLKYFFTNSLAKKIPNLDYIQEYIYTFSFGRNKQNEFFYTMLTNNFLDNKKVYSSVRKRAF